MAAGQTNYRKVHIKGQVELYINEVFVAARKYSSFRDRSEIVARWLRMYPYNPYQQRVLIVRPNWDLWNGKI
jgi:hypothetical protein